MIRNEKAPGSLSRFMGLLITTLRENGQYHTMRHYKSALNSYMRFRGNRDIALGDISTEEMQSYEVYLRSVARVCDNTSSFYLRILRAAYNKAVEKGLAPRRNSFGKVYTGIAKTRKRAIPVESVREIRRLGPLQGLTPKQELARDTFLMCFYLRGISFMDLAYLRKSDLRDGYLHYTRSKTGQRLSVRWEREMQEIVEKYRLQTASSPYLLPFLSCDKASGGGAPRGQKREGRQRNRQEEARVYHNAETRLAYHLGKLGARIGVKGRLTLYVARHSWATAARDCQIPISVISEALGHRSEATTQIYLRSIQSSEVDDANARLLAAIQEEGEDNEE